MCASTMLAGQCDAATCKTANMPRSASLNNSNAAKVASQHSVRQDSCADNTRTLVFVSVRVRHQMVPIPFKIGHWSLVLASTTGICATHLRLLRRLVGISGHRPRLPPVAACHSRSAQWRSRDDHTIRQRADDSASVSRASVTHGSWVLLAACEAVIRRMHRLRSLRRARAVSALGQPLIHLLVGPQLN